MIEAHSADTPLKGIRLLVLEDDMLVCMLLEEMLTELGCEIVPATRISEAIALASVEMLDGALLDVNLRGQPSYPVADKLMERQIPFAFITGYGSITAAGEYRNRPILQKPFQPAGLMGIISGLLSKKNGN